MTEEERSLIGNRFRTLRLEQGLTLKDVSERVGRNIKSIQLYETGTTTISLDIFVALCNIYGVSPDELLDSIIK